MAIVIGTGIEIQGGIIFGSGVSNPDPDPGPGPDPDPGPEPEVWSTYWYTDFESGSFTKTSGTASTGDSTSGDVYIEVNDGTVDFGEAYEGGYAYFCNSTVNFENRLRILVNSDVFSLYPRFKVEFYFKQTDPGDQLTGSPIMFEMGADPINLFGSPDKNYILMRWLEGVTSIGYDDTGPPGAEVSSPTWADPSVWNKVAIVIDRDAQTSEIRVNDVTVFGPHPTELPWADAQTSPDRVALSLYQLAYAFNGSSQAGYLDNFGLYVQEEEQE
jgi:hypothetical protein